MNPFLRYVGGKRRLVEEIRPWIPSTFNRYHEPFMGSAALFFALEPPDAVLSDANTQLSCTFGAVQRDLDSVIAPLKVYSSMYEKHAEAFYLHARDSIDPNDMSSSELAAWFIFMNKTNFQGMWRVNRTGKYNVPPGKFKTPPTVCDEPLLRACSMALANATIVNSDFREVERRAQPGDFVYTDPVYLPVSATADFTAYTKDGFTLKDHTDLRDLMLRLKRRGVHVLISNSDTPATRALYGGSEWEIREITRSGTINSVATKRQAVAELLIR